MQFHKIETYRIRICWALIVIGKLRPIKWVQYDTFFDCTRLSYLLYKAYRDNSFTRSDLTITQSKLHVDILGFWEFPECVNQVGSICLSVVLPCLVNFGFLLRDLSLWLRVRWWWVGRIGVFYYKNTLFQKRRKDKRKNKKKKKKKKEKEKEKRKT